MDLYIIERAGTPPWFAGTQAEAKQAARNRGGTWKPVVVPDRKEERLAWLNEFSKGMFGKVAMASYNLDLDRRVAEKLKAAPPARDMSAEACLSRMDGPPDIDRMVETICNSSGYPLKRFAGAVAVAFNNLANGG